MMRLPLVNRKTVAATVFLTFSVAFRPNIYAQTMDGPTAGAASKSSLDAADDPLLSVPKAERDRNAPADYGPGPGITASSLRIAEALVAAAPAASPKAGTEGVFGAAFSWPIIGLHAILLPDGRLLSYGSVESGKQGGFVYDIWDPRLGTAANSHTTLPNGTPTDIFCSAQSLMWGSGEALLTGGDVTVNNVRNSSSNATTIFNPATNTLRSAAPMRYARWYPSIVAMPNGDMVVLGGREERLAPTITPEVYRTGSGWRTLSTASSNAAYGGVKGGWYYPRAFLAPNGKVFIVGNDGKMFSLDPSGTGTLTSLPGATSEGKITLPTVMYATGKLLSVRLNRKVVTIDINGATPQVAPTGDIDQDRHWSNATVLADGSVFVSGGSGDPNKLVDVAYASMIWKPGTGRWSAAAAAAKPRLYHSITLLLPDATVLSMAGGAPGPVKNLNGEIYYPPYLYDASGAPRPRPEITNLSPKTAKPGTKISLTVPSGTTVSRVSLIRAGSVTHSTNLDQRYLSPPFSRSGDRIDVTLNGNSNVLQPGLYLVFIFDAAGAPSIAQILNVVNS